MKGRGRLEVLEMRIASSAGTNSSSLMPSSSSSSASTSSSVPYNPYMPPDSQKDEKKNEKEVDHTDTFNVNTMAIGMVWKEKGKKKKEKKAKAVGSNSDRNMKGAGGKSDDDAEYSLHKVFRGMLLQFHVYFKIHTYTNTNTCTCIHIRRHSLIFLNPFHS